MTGSRCAPKASPSNCAVAPARASASMTATGPGHRAVTEWCLSGRIGTIARMTQNATSAARGCVFCAIVARQAGASVVHEDETVVAFMDLNPVTPAIFLSCRVSTRWASKTSVEPRALTFGRSVMTWHGPCDAQAWAARESTSFFVMVKRLSRRSSTSTFMSSLATQETAGPSRPSRRNARGHSSTVTRKRSKTPSPRCTDRSLPLMSRSEHRFRFRKGYRFPHTICEVRVADADADADAARREQSLAATRPSRS